MIREIQTVVLLAALVASCRAFVEPIPDREGRLRVEASGVAVSMGDEFPEELTGAVAEPEARTHVEVVPAPAPAPAIGGDESVQLELRGVALRDALDDLARRAGVELLHEYDRDVRVELSAPPMPARQAFAWLLERHDLRVEQLDGRVHRVLDGRAAPTVRAAFQLRSTTVDAVSANVALIAGTDARVVTDASTGLVLVDGPAGTVREIAEFLDRVDRRQEQVLVEARILEVTLDENFGLGVTGVVDGSIDGGTLGIMQNLAITDDTFEMVLGSRDGSVEATIQAISRYVGTDLVSSPRILALSGSEAQIEVIREVPYVEVTSTTTGTTGGIGTQTLEEVQFKEAGVRLKVTPVVEDGGFVRMRIDQEFSEVAGRFNDIPVIDRRKIGADFLVRDRETVVLGGLMQDRRNEADAGVPGLADIPLLGRLFRSDEDERNKRELIVFLTPRIVDGLESQRLVRAMRRSYAETIRDTGVRATSEPQVSPW